MCDINKNERICAHHVDVSPTCKKTGKPITVTNEYGMFCEDLCGLQEGKDAVAFLNSLIPGIFH